MRGRWVFKLRSEAGAASSVYMYFGYCIKCSSDICWSAVVWSLCCSLQCSVIMQRLAAVVQYNGGQPSPSSLASDELHVLQNCPGQSKLRVQKPALHFAARCQKYLIINACKN